MPPPIVFDAQMEPSLWMVTLTFLQLPARVLVDGVIDNFKHAMVQAALIGIADVRAGPHADGFEAFKVLDLIGTIRLVRGDVSGVGEGR